MGTQDPSAFGGCLFCASFRMYRRKEVTTHLGTHEVLAIHRLRRRIYFLKVWKLWNTAHNTVVSIEANRAGGLDDDW